MLLLGSRLKNISVMSLQTGSEIARTAEPIIDPRNLEIIAYKVFSPLLPVKQAHYLMIEDVRELSDIGMIVDSIDALIEDGVVIRLDKLTELGFPLIHMVVTDEKKHRLGKVIDYTIDVTSFTIQQLTVKRPLTKRLNDTELLVHRSQIIEINNEAIVIHSKAETPEHTLVTSPGSYVNPFRKSQTASEAKME